MNEEVRKLNHGQVEVTLMILRDDGIVNDVLYSGNCSIERLSLRPKTTLHKVVCQNNESAIRDLLVASHLRFRKSEKGVFWVEANSCAACAFFASSFSSVMGSRQRGSNRLLYKVLLPSVKDLKPLVNALKDEGISHEVTSMALYVHKELTEMEGGSNPLR